MLDKQIHIFSLDTSNFYYDDEKELHNRNKEVRIERKKLINGFNEVTEIETIHHLGSKEILNKLSKFGYTEKQVNSICNNDDYDFSGIHDDIIKLISEYSVVLKKIKRCSIEARKTKNKLLQLFSERVNEKSRKLREDSIKNKDGEINKFNIVSVFDSFFTRVIGAEEDKFTEEFMIIQVYYFDIIKSLILNGFIYKGEKYIFFTSSAGQIRTKKCVFVKESTWKKYEKTIMCGLTLEDINNKGGCNPNKFLAYLALSNSATDAWSEFDIDKTIVIDDFETNVFGEYDFINETDYSITRKKDFIPITHTDGAGMILPKAFGRNQKNMMVRLPWIKGLLGVFDFKKFIKAHNCSPIIKDMYGKEHDVIAEDIQIIFTKSQFKMHKYYDSWEQYKKSYKKNNCSAGYTNSEEDKIKSVVINYQMLQSLTDITDDEINILVKRSVNKINNLCKSAKTIYEAFGATEYNKYQTPFQKAIKLYPELLNDVYIKDKIRIIKNSLLQKYRSGKIEINGKYTFLLPDFYAACEYWFLHNENPKGLLEDGEVYCNLFNNDSRLDCLRSPHLFCEHAIRRNAACKEYMDKREKIKEWFFTNGIYTSCKDLISKILMFDVDGDKSLVVADKTLIDVAERNIKKFDIVPLYYNMKKAESVLIDNQVLYDGLCTAFTGGNIGIYSNNISKIWNSKVFVNGTYEEKLHAIDCIKRLCCQNNFVIDYAKTLYKPEFPDKIKKEIKEFTKHNLPYFFIYAKDKEIEQVEKVNNSFVNKLSKVILNPRMNFKHIGGVCGKGVLSMPNYCFMMHNPSYYDDEAYCEEYKDIIEKYQELTKKYYRLVDVSVPKRFSGEVLMKSTIRQMLMYNNAICEVKKEFSKLGYSDIEIVDVLVRYLYGIKNSKHKDILWSCYGDYIYNNLKRNLNITAEKKMRKVQCEDCYTWYQTSINDKTSVHRCSSCYKRYRKERKLETQKTRRSKENEVSAK